MIFTLLTSKLGKALLAVVAIIGVLLGAVQYGKTNEKQAARVEELEVYVETKERISNVEVSPDRDAAVERLRDNGWVR